MIAYGLTATPKRGRHPGAKLTVDEVRWIRRQARGMGPVSVSEKIRRFKCDPAFAMLGEHTLRDVLDRTSWGDVS